MSEAVTILPLGCYRFTCEKTTLGLSGIDGVIDPIEFFSTLLFQVTTLDAGGEFPKPTQRIGELHLPRSSAVRLK